MRAQLDLAITADDDPDLQASALNLSSPDLTHSRLVRGGDTLPLLTAEVYGSPAQMLKIARFNDLDQLRELKPGRELLFPPIED
jgi:nucleoid-associated protein YgaU